MGIKLKILIVTLILNCPVFSQIDTSKICFPYSVAKLIAIDLVKGDSAIAELELTQDLLCQQNQKIIEQDTLIETYKQKEINYVEQLKYKDTIFNTQKQLISDLKQQNTILERKQDKQRSIIGGGLICTLTLLITSIISQ